MFKKIKLLLNLNSSISTTYIYIFTYNTFITMDIIESMVERRPLVIFSKSSCAICHTIVSLMRQFGANLMVYELDQIENGRSIEAALEQMGSAPSVPAVFIGERFVGGSNAVMSLHIQGKLVPKLIAAGAIFMWH